MFTDIATQWRVGMGGPIGLDYNVMLRRMDRMKLTDDAYEALFQDMRLVENEALSVLTQRDKK